MRRSVFVILTILLWLITALIACEVSLRFLHQWREDEVEEYIKERLEAGRTLDQEYVDKYPEPEDTPPVLSIPGYGEFPGLDKANRLYVAEKLGEIFLECDKKGVILSVYAASPPSASSTMIALANRLRVRDSFFGLLSEEQRADAQISLQHEIEGNGSFNREYLIALSPEFPESLFHFHFFGANNPALTQDIFYVAIRDALWEVQGKKFKPGIRPNYFGHGLYDYPGFSTNAAGFRDREIVLPKSPDTYRIVCIGGSTTFEGPRVDLTYPKILERMLRGAFATDRIEVVNCGVLSLDSIGELERAPDYLALDPDLIIHYNFVNDFFGRMTAVTYPMPPHDTIVGWLKSQMKNSALVFHYLPRLYLPSDADWLGNLHFITINNMRALGRAAKRQGVEVAVCSFAYPTVEGASRLEQDFFDKRIALNIGKSWLTAAQYGRYARLYASEVRHLCVEEGWTYIPVAENIQAGSEYFIDACHLYCNGIERKAEIIFEGVRDIVAREFTP